MPSKVRSLLTTASNNSTKASVPIKGDQTNHVIHNRTVKDITPRYEHRFLVVDLVLPYLCAHMWCLGAALYALSSLSRTKESFLDLFSTLVTSGPKKAFSDQIAAAGVGDCQRSQTCMHKFL